MNVEKKIVFIDMDGVLVDFKGEMELFYTRDPNLKKTHLKNPDEIPDIFKEPQPVEGAVEAVKKLHQSDIFELFIATTTPWDNPEASSHKRLWIETHFGDLFRKKMFITHRKDLLRGDYLIDDRLANGASEFKGELLSFGWAYEKGEKGEWNQYRTWDDILKKLLPGMTL